MTKQILTAHQLFTAIELAERLATSPRTRSILAYDYIINSNLYYPYMPDAHEDHDAWNKWANKMLEHAGLA